MTEAHRHMPQGVAENYRYWGDDQTVFVKEAQGCRFTDCDGREFVDFRLGYGPIILGYRDSRIDGAVTECISRGGTVTGFSTALDIEVVQQIKALCPNVEKLRFANSGTEAVMGALRTARGFTGRDRVVVVEGGFHGLFDEMMWKADVENWDPDQGQDPTIIPFGAGIPRQSSNLVDFIPLNDDARLEQIFKKHSNAIAAVLLEPIMGNCGSIAATPEWLQELRETCTKHGALLIMDEVKTGFRVARGGAQEHYGVQADLSTYAKAMGNGYPVACLVAGPTSWMWWAPMRAGWCTAEPTPQTWSHFPRPMPPSRCWRTRMPSMWSMPWGKRCAAYSAAFLERRALPTPSRVRLP
jgi:glutamate-1-semialdehyde 2,1-aminomutase